MKFKLKPMISAMSLKSSQQQLYASGIKMLETISLAFTRRKSRNAMISESMRYFMSRIRPGSTLIDIGAHKPDYLHQLRKLSKIAGELIVFEGLPESRRYLTRKKEILQLENVEIEDIHFAICNENVFASRQLCKSPGARVIDFSERVYKTVKQVNSETLDNYCRLHNFEPACIRINAEGQEMQILEGATALLTHRPALLITCEERFAGRERIWELFSLLTDLGYHGFFILGETKIPVANFDFNIYQNPVYDFYCSDFIFE